MERPAKIQPIRCAPDAEYHEYDVWGEHDEGSLEGSEDADAY